MGTTVETKQEPGPKTAEDLTLAELRAIAVGIGGTASFIDSDEMTGYLLSHPRALVDVFFRRDANKPTQTIVRVEGFLPINLGNPRVNIAPRSVAFVNDGDIYKDIFVLASDFYSHSRIVNEDKRR